MEERHPWQTLDDELVSRVAGFTMEGTDAVQSCSFPQEAQD